MMQKNVDKLGDEAESIAVAEEEEIKPPLERINDAGDERRLTEGLESVAIFELVTRIGEAANRAGADKLRSLVERFFEVRKNRAEGKKEDRIARLDEVMLMAVEELDPKVLRDIGMISYLLHGRIGLQEELAQIKKLAAEESWTLEKEAHFVEARKRMILEYTKALKHVDDTPGMLAKVRSWFQRP